VQNWQDENPTYLRLCELENLLFDHYSDAFTDLHREEEQEKQRLQKDFEWPFQAQFAKSTGYKIRDWMITEL
jgi:hypothetical protein